jgi:hypothetical protein
MLKNVENYKFCNEKKFEYESEGLCYKKGDIRLANTETPTQLMRLWTSNDSDALHFRNKRFLNRHFSFTTLYCQLDRDMSDIKNSGIYTFQAHGQIYHNVPSIGNTPTNATHLELYFYDDDPGHEHRYRHCRKELYKQDKHIMSILTDVLHNNPYSKQFRSFE